MIETNVIALLPPRLLVSHYLIASYCYYWQDCSPMSDHAFDLLCRRLYNEFDTIEHEHKHLVEREALTAGTCLLPEAKYPARIKHLWRDYITDALNGGMAKELLSIHGVTPTGRTRRTPRPAIHSLPPVRVRRTRPVQEPDPTPPPVKRIRRSVRPK